MEGTGILSFVVCFPCPTAYRYGKSTHAGHGLWRLAACCRCSFVVARHPKVGLAHPMHCPVLPCQLKGEGGSVGGYTASHGGRKGRGKSREPPASLSHRLDVVTRHVFVFPFPLVSLLSLSSLSPLAQDTRCVVVLLCSTVQHMRRHASLTAAPPCSTYKKRRPALLALLGSIAWIISGTCSARRPPPPMSVFRPFSFLFFLSLCDTLPLAKNPPPPDECDGPRGGRSIQIVTHTRARATSHCRA